MTPSVSEPRSISVRGTATVRTVPDHALLRLVVTALEPAPDAALAAATARADALARVLDEQGIAAVDRTSGPVSLREEHVYERGREQFKGFRAVARVAVRLTDAALAGRVVAGAVASAEARVSGPEWEVAPDNAAWLEAARAAADDARRRAEAYAERLGVRLGPVLRIAEDQEDEYESRRPRGAIAVAASAGDDGAPPLDPGEHDVTASVHVTFALEG